MIQRLSRLGANRPSKQNTPGNRNWGFLRGQQERDNPSAIVTPLRSLFLRNRGTLPNIGTAQTTDSLPVSIPSFVESPRTTSLRGVPRTAVMSLSLSNSGAVLPATLGTAGPTLSQVQQTTPQPHGFGGSSSDSRPNPGVSRRREKPQLSCHLCRRRKSVHPPPAASHVITGRGR